MADEQQPVVEGGQLAFKLSNKKIKPYFVVGGDWSLFDKSNKIKIFKAAKKENYEHFDNKYLGVAIERTRDINDYEGYALFKEYPKDAHSLALAHAIYCSNTLGAQEAGQANIPIVRFFHLRDDGGKEVVWITVIVDDIVREDRIVEQMSSFEAENDLRAEYGEIDFKQYEVDQSMEEFEKIWFSLSKKQQTQSRILSFAGYTKKIIVLGTMLAILIGAGLFGWNWYEAKQEEERLIEEKLAQEAEAARQIESLKSSEFPPVWIYQPTPSEVMAGVNNIISRTPLIVNGWMYGGVNFTVNQAGTELSASVGYKRDDKNPYMTPPGKISIQKPFQTIVTEKYKFPKHEREAGIMKRKNAETWLLQMSIGKPYKTVFTFEDSPSKTVNVGSSTVEIIAAYQLVKVQISELSDISGLGELLNAPGFVINTLSQSGHEWKLTGTLYVLP